MDSASDCDEPETAYATILIQRELAKIARLRRTVPRDEKEIRRCVARVTELALARMRGDLF